MRIRITEAQFHKLIESEILKEYLDSSFNWDRFNSLSTPNERYRYCIEKLGQPIGRGTSRAVFEVDDCTVLKLSYDDNDKLEQNKEEYMTYLRLKNPLLPKIYGHADDFSWLWTERVIPANYEDFEKILGIPWYNNFQTPKSFIGQYDLDDKDKLPISDLEGDKDDDISFGGFLRWYVDYQADYLWDWSEKETETFKMWLRHPWFQYLTELFEVQSIDEFCIDNFGIALRNGKPTIVVLDIGWSEND